MNFFPSLVANSRGMLAAISMVLLLTSCGGNPVGASGGTAALQTATSGPTPVSFDIAGLHIQVPSFGDECNEWVELANPAHLTYDDTALQQMKAWNSSDQAGSTPPPPTLSLVVGQLTGKVDGVQWVAADDPTLCKTSWEITNTSAAPITILQVGVQLTAAPQQNNQQYPLINRCSLVSPDQGVPDRCPGRAGGGGSICAEGKALIQLSNNQPGSVFQSPVIVVDPPDQNTPCPPFTLEPGQLGDLQILLGSAGTPDNLTYAIVPQLTLVIAGKQQLVTLPHLASILTFADPNQFSCFTLQENTFVLLNQEDYARGYVVSSGGRLGIGCD